MFGGSPDFVILGSRYGEKFMVLASDRLTHASLSMHADYYIETLMSGPVHDPLRRTYELETEMLDVRMVVADSYAEAMMILFREWSPRQDRPAEISNRQYLDRFNEKVQELE